MPSHSPLEQLRHLDRSSSEFHDRVSNILYGEDYKKWVQTVQGDDLVGLVDYLDKVRYPSHSFAPRSSRYRLSTILTLPVPLSESACANSDTYAAPERYYHLRIRSRPKF